jgi:hypothetical protein
MDIVAAYPQVRFLPASYFSYDSSEDIINYDPKRLKSIEGKVSLLHEIAHQQLGHFHYNYDLELFMMEVEAWHLTRELAYKHGLAINDEYIEECIDTYDSWVEARANCPKCETFCLQEAEAQYHCFRCDTRWKVSTDLSVSVRRKIQN